MASVAAEPFKGLPPKKVDGRRFKVGIVYARWNLKITTALVEGARYGDGELLHLVQGALRLTPQLLLAGRRCPPGFLQEGAARGRHAAGEHYHSRGAGLVRAAFCGEPNRRQYVACWRLANDKLGR